MASRCAIWARVSTDEQESGNQLAELGQWAARVGRYDVLLCWALDRLSREGVEATLGLLRRFHEAGAPVWSLREPWTETADPHMAELLGAIYAWMARAESAR